MKIHNNTTNLTEGSIVSGLIRFAVPLMIGNVLQQCYNIVDTLVVGRFVGDQALAAVGSAYTIMVFLTSIILGLSMGSGAYLSMTFGAGRERDFREGHFMSFMLIGGSTLLLNILVYAFLDPILHLLQIPTDVYPLMRTYTQIILGGLLATFFFNYFASVLRAVGNSMIPLIFLGISSLVNIGLDLLFVIGFGWGVTGAASATVLSQYLSGIGIMLYSFYRIPLLRFARSYMNFRAGALKRILSLAVLTSLQQSIMNFGILMVQGRVNSFGTAVMAAFAAAVKIDTLAYSPVQDFGNAFSTFVAQNHGAGKTERIREGMRRAAIAILVFCAFISAVVFCFAGVFMGCFTSGSEIIAIGVRYLRIEGVFYCLIGFLFMFYGYFRAMERPMISVILTVISLGTRVVLAYALSAIPEVGVTGIWVSIPIGWALADLAGMLFSRSRAA